MFHIFPFQRPRGHESSLLADVESVALVAVHDGEGERWAVVGSVPVRHGELKNTCALRSVLLWGTREDRLTVLSPAPPVGFIIYGHRGQTGGSVCPLGGSKTPVMCHRATPVKGFLFTHAALVLLYYLVVALTRRV